jgi:hypothetical protein
VISDGLLHAKITSPLRGATLRAFLTNNQAAPLSAVSDAGSPTGVTFTWTIRKISETGILEVPGTTITGQKVSFTPSYPDGVGNACVTPMVQIEVAVTDQIGRVADDRIIADVAVFCRPN